MTMQDSIRAARIGNLQDETGSQAVFNFCFGADDPMFAGHFPKHPLLPGIFQLEMTRSAAEWTLNSKLTVREIFRAKFQRPILPDEIVRLELKLIESNGAIRARGDFFVGAEPAGETVLLLWPNQF